MSASAAAFRVRAADRALRCLTLASIVSESAVGARGKSRSRPAGVAARDVRDEEDDERAADGDRRAGAT